MTEPKYITDALQRAKESKRNYLRNELNKKTLSMTKRSWTKVKKLQNFIQRLKDNKQVQNSRIEQIIEFNKDDYLKDIANSNKATSKQVKIKYCDKELAQQIKWNKQVNKKITF